MQHEHCAENVRSYSGFLCVFNRQTGLLDPGMLVNIQQPLIREDGTVLLATDSKVTFSPPVCCSAGCFSNYPCLLTIRDDAESIASCSSISFL